MTSSLSRREALAGLLAGLAGLGCAGWGPLPQRERMREDFAAGDVHQVRGWFVSRTEAEEMGPLQGEPVFPAEP